MAFCSFPYRVTGFHQFLQDHVQRLAAAGTAVQIIRDPLRVPGNALGKNGSLRFTLKFSATNNANVKTAVLRLGDETTATGTALATVALASLEGAEVKVEIANRDNEGVQLITVTAPDGTKTFTAGSINTGLDQFFHVTLQKATGGDVLALESFVAELFNEPTGFTFR